MRSFGGEVYNIITINLKNLQNQKKKKKDKKEKKHWLLKMQLDLLKKDKKFLMILKAKYL